MQAPSTYDPIVHPEQSRNRFNQVLDRLLDDGFVTQVDYDAAMDTFVLPERVQRRAERVSKRTYYSEALRDYLLNRSNILGDTYEERYTRLYRGGLSIHTTLDPFVQARAEEARNQLPDNTLGIDAAITSLETKTGAIRAMVGGKGFIPGQREVNLALAPSQTGSSIKLFVLAAALQAGATPDDLIDGHPSVHAAEPGRSRQSGVPITGGVNGGLDTLRSHTVRSINCAFSRLAQIVGLNRMVDTVYRMASNPYLYPGQPAEERLPIQPYGAFSIGANEMSTLDMASGIQTIANEGVHMQPYFVEYIDDARGERVYTHNDPGTPVLDRQVALTAIDVLKGVLTGGTARGRAGRSRRPPAGVRQDRHAGEELDGVLRRRHAVPVDRRAGARPRPLHADGGSARVRRRRRRPGAGRHVPSPHLGCVHGRHRSRAGRARRRLGAPRSARSPAGAALPPGQRVRLRGDRLRAGRTTEPSRRARSRPVDDLAGEPPAGFRSPAARHPPPSRPATAPPAHRTVADHDDRTTEHGSGRSPSRSNRATTPPPRPILSPIRDRHYHRARCARPPRPAAVGAAQRRRAGAARG